MAGTGSRNTTTCCRAGGCGPLRHHHLGIGYLIAYPAIPLINGATPGVLGESMRSNVAAEIKRFNEANAPIQAKRWSKPC